LVVCIDGTWCTADGPHGKGYGNTSNTYRVCASVKKDVCFDPIANREIIQRKIYMEGVGSADSPRSLKRFVAGITGEGYQDRIKEAYEECCKLNEQDEIWLYGFSRGAFIARAVAGLLHYVGALASAGTARFSEEYSKTLRLYKNFDDRSRIGPGQVSARW
jgi:uncharacterized protein (DUF2235 family)